MNREPTRAYHRCVPHVCCSMLHSLYHLCHAELEHTHTHNTHTHTTQHHTHTHTPTHSHTHPHTHTHTRTHTHARIHIHTHAHLGRIFAVSKWSSMKSGKLLLLANGRLYCIKTGLSPREEEKVMKHLKSDKACPKRIYGLKCAR